jgi:hypothetical protein
MKHLMIYDLLERGFMFLKGGWISFSKNSAPIAGQDSVYNL